MRLREMSDIKIKPYSEMTVEELIEINIRQLLHNYTEHGMEYTKEYMGLMKNSIELYEKGVQGG